MRKRNARFTDTVACAAATLMLATGCQWVALDPEAEAVRVLAASDDVPPGCEHLSNTQVEVPDGAWIFGRRTEKVEGELETLARNAASEAGGNAIEPLGPVDAGSRRYRILRCP